MIPAIVYVLFGLALGSFLNVCITRLPRGESVLLPGSHCRRCGAGILKRDNVPALSWILLRGRCRSCGASIPRRYPAVEIATSALFLLCGLQFGPNWVGITWATLCFLLLGLAVTDMETMLLPNRFILPGIVLGLLFAGIRNAVHAPESAGTRIVAGLRGAAEALIHAGIAATFLLCIMGLYWLIRRRAGMGMGDVKLLAMLATWLGLPQTALVLAIAVICGAACGLVMLAGSKDEDRGALSLPFGAFLSLAGIYCIFLGERTVRWYAHFLA